MNTRWTAILTASLLIGCVSSDGSKALKREDPTEAAAKTNIQLGIAYLQQGNYAVAREKLERSLKQNPKDPDVHTSLGLLYDRVGETKLADKHFREALKLAPDNPDVSNNYAIYLCKRGRVDEGVERFSAVATNKYYRTPEVALSNAGVCLRGAKRYEEAGNAFAHALQIRPNYAEAMFQAADLRMERGEIAEGREQLDKYLQSYDATADLLLLGVRMARAQNDRMGEEKYTRRLRVEFAGSEQLRSLEPNRNPG